jgi:hypothetical protein
VLRVVVAALLALDRVRAAYKRAGNVRPLRVVGGEAS